MYATRFITIRAIRRAVFQAWTLPAVAAIAFLAVACSSGDDATSTPVNTPAPTATTAAPTAASEPPAETSGTVTIGSVMPSTGDLGVFGPDMIAAVDIVASEVNAAGGLNGKALQILHRDSATNEQVAADAANALVNVDGAVAIVGGMSSGITLSIAQSVAIPNGILQVSPASSSPAITFLDDNDFVFRTNVSDALQGGIIADVATELGYDSIATTYINNAYGEGLSRVFTEGFEGNGGTITGQVGHESGQVSYLAELRQAAQDDAEALIVIAYPETASVLLRESVEGDFFDNYIFVDGVHSQSIFDEVGGNAFDGSYGSVSGSPISQAQRDYIDLFRQETGRESDNPYPGFAFDAAAIIALAIEHADSEDPADIRDSLREVANPPGEAVGPKELARALQLIRDGQDVNYVGAGGDQDFDEQGDVVNTIRLWRINGNQIEDLDIYLKPGDPVVLPDDTSTGMMQSEATGDQTGTVAIGSVMPSTGDLGVFGPDMIAAVDIVASEVNAAGGVNGKELQVLHRDSATNEQVATDAANALVNVDGAVAIIGGMSSGITLSIAQSVSIPNGIVQVSPASSSPAITFLDDGDFVFRTNVSDALQGGIIADVATELGFDRIATTYINNAYGEGLSRVFTEGFESNGGTITGQVGHESGQVSYLAELRQAAQDDAEALIVIAYPETASVLLRESVEGDFFDNYIFVDGVHSQSIFDEVGGDAFDGSYGSVAGSPISQAQRDYIDLFRQQTGGESDNPYPGFAFDAAAIVALAIEHADSENPADIRDSLRAVANPPGESVGPKDLARALELIRSGQDVNYVGAGGDQDFDAQGDVINTIQLWRINGSQIEDLDIYLKPGDPVVLPTSMMQPDTDDTDAAISFQIGEGSEAIFKVDETLRGVDVVVAMQTNLLTGQIDLAASSANIEIDLHSLTSDQARRDRYARERMFPQYPITSVSFPGLGAVPADFTTSGQEFTTVLPASVTVNGNTAELDFNITARVDNGTDLVVLGTADFVWADFGMTAPVSSFFQVEDDVRVEILLRAKHR